MSHILLIESNTVLADLYTQALQHHGHSVACASGAQAAIDAADAQQPELVILELYLPEHSGLEFLHEFRSYPEWQDVPVVVHTALPPNRLGAATEALRRDFGVCEVLYKPRTTLQVLARIVRQYAAAKTELA